MLTAERARELFDYDELTGILTWKIRTSSRSGIGDEAGCANKIIGYRYVGFDGIKYLAHRLIYLMMTGAFPKYDIDHIDRDRDNNRWNNIRHVTHAENMKNQPLRATSKSGICGVRWYERYKKWHAQIRVNNHTKHLGYFFDIEDAKMARKDAEAKYNFHINHGRRVSASPG